MAEFTSNAVQTIAVGQNVLFTESPIPCNRGYVLHREGSGILTLRGIVNNPCGCFARYKIFFGGNIAVPTGGTAGPISVALAIDGEPIPTSSSIVTPAAVEEFWNVSESLYVTVPKGCCYTIAVENTSDQPIEMQNANIIVERTA
jgi:hypothetical protein